MKNIAVILSGCGVLDGAEIHESVATLLAIDRTENTYQCFAPNIAQSRVVNHLTNEATSDARNVLVESARIARGEIKDIQFANIEEFDAAVYPGGFGVALNLCDFAVSGVNHTVQKELLYFSKAMAAAKKPQGFMCIAPALIAKIYGAGVKITIGSDKPTVNAMIEMGNHHEEVYVTNVVVDKNHKVVTTPAYMLATRISEVFDGVDKLVKHVVSLCH